jgi:acetyltransferase-like isoleucine patch superfamily enzyme
MGLLSGFFRLMGRPYYVRFSLRHLLLNWIFQRVFGVNGEVPFSVNFTNKVSGWHNCYFEDHSVEANLFISKGAYIAVFEDTSLSIGSGTIWACNICIQTADHVPGDLGSFKKASVSIGRNCWLGNGVVITAGVVLGDNVVVGANAVVTHSFPSNVIIGGVPARVIGQVPHND